MLTTERFAHAVAIDVDGFVPDDNYLQYRTGRSEDRPTERHRAQPGSARLRVRLERPRNAVPVVVTEAVHAG